jgi:uncharacterized membrane-anchored protein YitT (DUF2179 family)
MNRQTAGMHGTGARIGAAPAHTILEDTQALLAGTLLAALGVTLLDAAHLVTGGVVGLTFLLRHWLHPSFGLLFFALNLPFYLLAIGKKGWHFTLKTFCAVLLLSALADWMPLLLQLDHVHPLFAAVAGGLLLGVGLLILFRHQASLGGLNILVLYLQERFGWSAGLVQLGIDGAILLISALVVGPSAAALSLLAAAVLNLTLAVNHRPGRYLSL